MNTMSRIAATAAVVIAMGVGGVALAAPASAINCNSYGTVKHDTLATLTAKVPAVRSGNPDVGYSYNYSCVLGPSAQNSGVTVLQQALKTCEHFSLTVDGVYGFNTENAISTLQYTQGWTTDGKYGPQTRGIMHFVASSGYCFPIQAFKGF